MSIIGQCGGGARDHARNEMTILQNGINYSSSGTPNAQTSTVMNGTASLTSNPNTFWRPWEASKSEFMLHYHFKRTTTSTGNDVIKLGWGKNQVLLGAVSFADNTGLLRIRINGSTVQTSTSSYSISVWERIHVHVKLGGAGVGFVKVYMDGNFTTPVAEELAVSTDPTSATTANGFYTTLVSNTTFCANLICIDPNDGLSPTTLDDIGSIGIYSSVPDADSATHTDWTPDSGVTGYTQIDEIPNSDSDYVEATTVGERSTFSHEALSGVAVDVIGVQYLIRTQRTGTTAGSNITLTRRLSTTDYDESPVTCPTDGDVSKIYNEKPGGGAWTIADLDNTEFGFVSAT